MLLTLGLAMWIKGLLSVAFLFVCVILILTVLIQRPSGGGLSGAFGSASGSGQTAFGAKTGDALTIFTIVMFVVFVLGGIGMKFVTTPSQGPTPAALTSGQAPAPGGAQPAPLDGAPAPVEGEAAPGPGAIPQTTPEQPPPDPAGDGSSSGGG
ncbi:MAG: preprotein translocase subunit SecG [Phycisphaerales bacterium JB039]